MVAQHTKTYRIQQKAGLSRKFIATNASIIKARPQINNLILYLKTYKKKNKAQN